MAVGDVSNISTTSESLPWPGTQSTRKWAGSGSGSATGSDSLLDRRRDDDRRLLLFRFFLLLGRLLQPGALQFEQALARRFRILTVRVAVEVFLNVGGLAARLDRVPE